MDKEDTRRLATIRAERGYSRKELAKVSGVSEYTIMEYETEMRLATPGTMDKLCKALGIARSEVAIDYATGHNAGWAKKALETNDPQVCGKGVERFRAQADVQIGQRLKRKLSSHVGGAGWVEMEVVEIRPLYFRAKSIGGGWCECFDWQDFLTGNDYVKKKEPLNKRRENDSTTIG